jgi:thiol-disulfide isomerase/thioredoxin
MKNWTIKGIIKEIFITLVMIFVISFIINYLRKPDTFNRLPDIKALSIDGKEVKFETKGEPLVVHFWATWCPTCKLEAPNIDSIKNDINVITVAVNSGTNEELKKFMKEHEYNYTVINDSNGELAKKFGVEAYPTTFIYNKDGKLEFAEIGYSTKMGIKARVALIND